MHHITIFLFRIHATEISYAIEISVWQFSVYNLFVELGESVVMSTCKDMCAERTRSSSLGRARGYRARYWAYLLDNLQKAKDEICDVCERDQDILACKEALLVLNNYSKELIALIELIRLNDKLEKTPEPCRCVHTVVFSIDFHFELSKSGSYRHTYVIFACITFRNSVPEICRHFLLI